MKTIEIIKNLSCPVLISGLGGLLSLGISVSAWGTCVQDLPGANTVMTVSRNQSCDDINGQFGCRARFRDFGGGIRVGSCAVYDDDENVLFSVVGKSNNQDGLSWTILDPTDPTPRVAKVNTAIIKTTEETCNYVYDNESVAGSGQGWFEGSEVEGSFSDVTSAYFCTDGETDDAPAPPCKPDVCAIISPDSEETFVITLKPGSPDWSPDECTCFEPEIWTECNEDATVDEGANKCTGDGILQALHVSFDAINDGTTICRTIGGERKCWKKR